MDLIILILGIALIGLLAWAITTYIPMPEPFKLAIYVLCAIALIFFIIRRFAGNVPNVLN